MSNVTIDRIAELAEDAASKINNALELGTTSADHAKIKRIVASAVAKAVAEQRIQQ